MKFTIRKHKQLGTAMYIAQPEICSWFNANSNDRPEGAFRKKT